MKYLIDAQLPYLLAEVLRSKGYNVMHTDDLPNKDETSDTVIRQIATREDRIVITKNSDFLDSYLLLK
jgi:predicted nuclease of predicted toxin-antitoxin system